MNWSAPRMAATIVQRTAAQISGPAMSECRSGDILAGQSDHGGEYVHVGTVKHPVSQLLPDDLMDSLPTVEEIEAELSKK